MKRELGLARCGLACCLCSENTNCAGCNSGECPGKDWCENRKCSLEKGIGNCYACDEDCRKGLLSKIKPYAFNRMGAEKWTALIYYGMERNEFRRTDVGEIVNVILYVYQGVRMWSRIVPMSSENMKSITSHIKKQLLKEDDKNGI